MNNICIVGNIGAGKTALTKALCRVLPEFTSLLEPDVQQNPFLNDFVKAPSEYALHNQLFFLWIALSFANKRVHMRNTIQDFSIIGCPIFAEAMMLHNILPKREYDMYEKLCMELLPNTPPPSLYILVRANVTTLVTRIRKRGRLSEHGISPKYLSTLQALHDSRLVQFWMTQLPAPLIRLNTDQFDVFNISDVQHLATQIRNHLEIA